MTFKEFLEKKPNEIEKAKKCKNIEEFKKLAKSVGITYNKEEELKNAYDFVKGSKALSDDVLEAASGGAAYYHDPDDVYYNKNGELVVVGPGKKV